MRNRTSLSSELLPGTLDILILKTLTGGPAAARQQFGNAVAAQERARDIWIAPWFRDVWQDIRFAARSLIQDRAFT